MTTINDILTQATKLADAVAEDINANGGLTSTVTIRSADELRLAIARFHPVLDRLEVGLIELRADAGDLLAFINS